MKDLAVRTLLKMLLMLLVLLDISVNRLFNGRVETISARAGRGVKKGKTWAKILCRILDKIDPGHCEDALKDPQGGLK